MELRLQIAGIALDVACEGDALERFCRDYRTNDRAESALSICVDRQAIEAERQNGLGREMAASEGYYATIALCRRLCERLPEWDAMLFHASALSVDGVAYLFAAPSGTGKSTHASLWRQVFGDRVTMINDDKPILRRINGVWMACGSPWNGKHRLSQNCMAPIGGICILDRGMENTMMPIDPIAAMPALYRQIQRLTGEDAMKRQMSLLGDLLCTVPLYRMYCQPTPEAAMMAYTTMVGGRK